MHSAFGKALHCLGLLTALQLSASLRAQDDAPPPTKAESTAEVPGLDKIDLDDLKDHLITLAADKMEGRATGTRGNDRAAAYIQKHFKKLGLEPGAKDGKAWFQPFIAESSRYKDVPTKNVLAFLPGTDESLAEEIVILGAHYDHVGVGKFGSREAGRGGLDDKIHNGADDNASGSAGLLELAEAFSKHPTRRGILFIAFSGEELGLLGSKYYCEHPERPLEQVTAMINFDMIGRSTEDYLFLGGVGTSPIWPDLIKTHLDANGLAVERGRGGIAPTDSSSFYEKDIPVLFFHTNLHLDYHRVSDHSEFINFGGELKILRAAYPMIRAVADADKRPEFTMADEQSDPRTVDEMNRLPSRARDLARMARGRAKEKLDKKGCGRLGFSPGSSIRGEVLISEILSQGPLGAQGLDTGDVVLAVNGEPVSTSRDIAAALKGVKKGTEIEVEVRQDGEKKTLTVEVGR